MKCPSWLKEGQFETRKNDNANGWTGFEYVNSQEFEYVNSQEFIPRLSIQVKNELGVGPHLTSSEINYGW